MAKKKVLTLKTIQRMSQAELKKTRSVAYFDKLFALLQNEFPSMLGNYIVVTGSKVEELGAQGALDLFDASDLNDEDTAQHLDRLTDLPRLMRGDGLAHISMSVSMGAKSIILNDFPIAKLTVADFIHEIAHITTTHNGENITTTMHGYTHIINKLKLLGLDQIFLNGTNAERRVIINKAFRQDELVVACIEFTVLRAHKEGRLEDIDLYGVDFDGLSASDISYSISNIVGKAIDMKGFEPFISNGEIYKDALIKLGIEGSDVI